MRGRGGAAGLGRGFAQPLGWGPLGRGRGRGRLRRAGGAFPVSSSAFRCFGAGAEAGPPSPSWASSSPRRARAWRSRSRALSMRCSSSCSSPGPGGPEGSTAGRRPLEHSQTGPSGRPAASESGAAAASAGSSRKRTRRSLATARRTRVQLAAPADAAGASCCWSSRALGTCDVRGWVRNPRRARPLCSWGQGLGATERPCPAREGWGRRGRSGWEGTGPFTWGLALRLLAALC